MGLFHKTLVDAEAELKKGNLEEYKKMIGQHLKRAIELRTKIDTIKRAADGYYYYYTTNNLNADLGDEK